MDKQLYLIVELHEGDAYAVSGYSEVIEGELAYNLKDVKPTFNEPGFVGCWLTFKDLDHDFISKTTFFWGVKLTPVNESILINLGSSEL